MKNRYTLEIAFLLLAIGLALAGFSGLYLGAQARANAFHHLHVATSLGWLALLLCQLCMLRSRRFQHHRAIGLSIFGAGPLLVATSVLLSVHSASRDAVAGRADAMVVQNVSVALELALLLWLAFMLRRRREVHGALLMGTALLFMGIALFFTLIAFVPGYRIEGPGTFHRFAEAGETGALATAGVGLLFFLRNVRTGWPWLLAGSCFLLNGMLQEWVMRNDATLALTRTVAAIDPAAAFGLSLAGFTALLLLAWKRPYRGSDKAGSAPGARRSSSAAG